MTNFKNLHLPFILLLLLLLCFLSLSLSLFFSRSSRGIGILFPSSSTLYLIDLRDDLRSERSLDFDSDLRLSLRSSDPTDREESMERDDFFFSRRSESSPLFFCYLLIVCWYCCLVGCGCGREKF